MNNNTEIQYGLLVIIVSGLFSTDTPLPLSALQLLAPPLRLMSAAMWKVMLKRDVVYYGKLEEIVTTLCETVPGLLQYRHRARLTMGLRALVRLLKSTVTFETKQKKVNQQLILFYIISSESCTRMHCTSSITV